MREPIPLSHLGFGCAPIMGRISKSHALRALAFSFDCGVTHFDVARSYGFGQAEEIVGGFIKGKRDKVTVTTKFGVIPPALGFRAKTLIPIARQAVNLIPSLRRRLKTKSGELLAARNFDVAYARKCLHQSLTELQTDYIDIYLIHEPDQSLNIDTGALQDFMEENIQLGKIRRWGYAMQSVSDYAWVSCLGGDVIQFEGNIHNLADIQPILPTTKQRLVTRPFASGELDDKWRSGSDQFGPLKELKQMGLSPTEIMLCIARVLGGESGTVLCGMFSNEHIARNARTLAQYQSNKEIRSKIIEIIHGPVPAAPA